MNETTKESARSNDFLKNITYGQNIILVTATSRASEKARSPILTPWQIVSNISYERYLIDVGIISVDIKTAIVYPRGMKRQLAIFDFDNTLVTKDSLWDFLYFSSSTPEFARNVTKQLPVLISHKLGIIPAQRAKELLIGEFFRGRTREDIDEIMSQYSLRRIPKIINTEIYNRFQWHGKQKHKRIIATASIENWILPWATKENVDHVLATRLMFRDGKFTGFFRGQNCSGTEKVLRLKKVIPNHRSYKITVYSDNKSDRALFNIADEVHFLKRNRLQV